MNAASATHCAKASKWRSAGGTRRSRAVSSVGISIELVLVVGDLVAVDDAAGLLDLGDERVDGGEDLCVAVLGVGAELLGVLGRPLEEGGDRGLREGLMELAVAELLEVERVERLLELTDERDGVHGLLQIHRFAHEREATAGDDRARARQVVDEAGLGEGLELDVAEALVSVEPVDDEAAGQALQRRDQLGEAIGRLVDEDVIAGAGASVEDRVAQDRWKQGRALLAHLGEEEARDEVGGAARQL